MEEFIKKNKGNIVWGIILGFLTIQIVALSFKKIIMPHVIEKIKEEIKQPYGPSPFGPSINADRVRIDGQESRYGSAIYETTASSYVVPVQNYNEWQSSWEKDRVNP